MNQRIWLGPIALLMVISQALTPLASAAEVGTAPPGLTMAVDTLAGVDLRVMPPVDLERLRAEDEVNDSTPRSGPARFAEPIAVSFSLRDSGTWEVLEDGSWLWRLRISSPGALSLNLGLTSFDPGDTGRLWLYDPAGEQVRGPYDVADRTPAGELWTPLVLGSELVVEVQLPATDRARADIEIGRVNHGYRFFGESKAPGFFKQGWCNNDVVCPEGDDWRDEIRSVGWYTVNGWGTCTGTLVNNVEQDLTPYFLSAEHCTVTAGNAGSIVVYWNYESANCGDLSGGSFDDSQSGATFRASWESSDFLLFELDEQPDESFGVYYAGWDAGGSQPQGAVCIHHPDLDEKAISFDDDPLTSSGGTHWRVGAWDDGTTEPGSSGSCIFDPTSHLCVGTLTGGTASCSLQDDPDYFGKVSKHLTGGGTSDTRLRDWLDPMNTGATSVQGLDPADGPVGGDCTEDATTLCLNGDRFMVTCEYDANQGQSGQGQAVELTDDTGYFWFFNSDNVEMVIKVLDGCGVNQHHWVYAGGLTNVEVDIRVEDTANGTVMTYSNAQGTPFQPIQDSTAFATCP